MLKPKTCIAQKNEILKILCRKSKYLKQENKGPGAARNLGLDNSDGELVAFIDSDCEADINWLNIIYESFKKNNFDVIIHCGITLNSIEQNLSMFFNIEKHSNYFGRLICIGSGAEFDSRSYKPRMNEKYFGNSINKRIKFIQSIENK